jgi:hypothetical protein
MLGRDDLELFGEPRHAGEPNSEAAAAMEKEQRGPCSAAHEADAAIADADG